LFPSSGTCSQNICCRNYEIVNNFSKDFTSEAAAAAGVPGVPAPKFALVRFATDATTLAGLGLSSGVITALNNVDYTGGFTNTGEAIETCRSQLTNSIAARKVILLITDGTPTVDADGDTCSGTSTSNNCFTYATTQANSFKATASNLLVTLYVNTGAGSSSSFTNSLATPGFGFSAEIGAVDNVLDGILAAVACGNGV
jgi:hypothetical protein